MGTTDEHESVGTPRKNADRIMDGIEEDEEGCSVPREAISRMIWCFFD